MRPILILLFVASIVAAGCASDLLPDYRQRQRATIANLDASLKKIDVVAGMTENDAQNLVQYYYLRYVSIESALGDVSDMGEYWQATVFIGIAGHPSGSIKVYKKTGGVESEWGPTFYSLHEVLSNGLHQRDPRDPRNPRDRRGQGISEFSSDLGF